MSCPVEMDREHYISQVELWLLIGRITEQDLKNLIKELNDV